MEVKSCLKLCCGLAGASYILSQKKWNIDKENDTLNFKNRVLRQNCVNAETEEGIKPIILVVGAGLTGCLTTYLARKKYGDQIDLYVMERSPYPSGRFGAGLRYNTSKDCYVPKEAQWCDMGSQVLSVLNCDSDHPNACTSGHGMRDTDLKQAWELAKHLQHKEIITRVPNDGEMDNNALDVTEERMIFDNLWAHFWPSRNNRNVTGLSGVMAYLLEEAYPTRLEFQRQVKMIERDHPSNKMVIYSTPKSSRDIQKNQKDASKIANDNSFSKGNLPLSGLRKDTADAVIVTIPSVHAHQLTHHLLPDKVSADLVNIQYESRAVCSFVAQMSPTLAMQVCNMFGPNKTEINYDMSIKNEIDEPNRMHLIIWQNRKYENYSSFKSAIEKKLQNHDTSPIEMSFTCHSKVDDVHNLMSSHEFEKYSQDYLQRLLNSKRDNGDISSMKYENVSFQTKMKTNVDKGENDTHFEILKSRSVIWEFSQPASPMEALYREVEDLEKAYPQGPIYSDNNGLILAGDYFAQSSFVGCFCSAVAAVRAISDVTISSNRPLQ